MKNVSRILLTPTFRLYYPSLLEPRSYQKKGQAKGAPKYSLSMIFEPDALKKFKIADDDGELVDVNIRDVLKELAVEGWPDIDDIPAAIKHGGIKWPIRKGEIVAKKKDGTTKHAEHLDGNFVINAASSEQYPPSLKAYVEDKQINLTRGLTADDTKIKNLFAGGNYAFAEVNVKPTEVDENKFLTFYLNAICFTKPGERIGGGGSLMDKYQGTHGGEADVDPTEGADDYNTDDIPF